jgi:hypothetical protein
MNMVLSDPTIKMDVKVVLLLKLKDEYEKRSKTPVGLFSSTGFNDSTILKKSNLEQSEEYHPHLFPAQPLPLTRSSNINFFN